jgi:ABC-type transport system involved in cytochrome c biogenesis permease subunit
MQLLSFQDYQLPILASFFLFVAMILYWVSLFFPKTPAFFQIGRSLVLVSNLLFLVTLASRWLGENYFPLSNLYESLLFLSWGVSTLHLFV